jgi:hypothetical protein
LINLDKSKTDKDRLSDIKDLENHSKFLDEEVVEHIFENNNSINPEEARKSTLQSIKTAKKSDLIVLQDSYKETLIKMDDNEKLFHEQVLKF